MRALPTLSMLWSEIEKPRQDLPPSCIPSSVHAFVPTAFPLSPQPTEPYVQVEDIRMGLVPVLRNRRILDEPACCGHLDAFDCRRLLLLRKWERKKLYAADYDFWKYDRCTSNGIYPWKPSPIKLRSVRFIVLKGPAINGVWYVDLQGRLRVDFCTYTQLYLHHTWMDDKRDRKPEDALKYCTPPRGYWNPIRLYGGPVSFVSWISNGFSGKACKEQISNVQGHTGLRFFGENREKVTFYDAIYPHFDRTYLESQVIQHPGKDPRNVRLYTQDGLLYEQHPLLYVLVQTVDRIVDKKIECYWHGKRYFLDPQLDNGRRICNLLQMYSYAHNYIHNPERKEIVVTSLSDLADTLYQEYVRMGQHCAEWNRDILLGLPLNWKLVLARNVSEDVSSTSDLEQTEAISALRDSLRLLEKYS